MHRIGKEWAAGACLVVALAGLTACQVTTRQKAASLTPITVPAFEETKPIAFKRIVLKIPRNKSIGQVRVGLLCIPAGNLTRSGGRYALDSSIFNDVFRDELESANYKVVGDPDQLFGDPELSKAEYFVAGLIKDIEANVCYPGSGFGDVTSSSAGVYMEVEWQIYDTLRRQVILKLSTEGSAQTRAMPGGVAIAFENAFAHAAQNLLAQNEFYELVRFGTGASYAAATGFANINKDELRIEEGSGIDPDLLAKSTAVIRSPQGHGSGFLITPDILLTNQHVVGAATKVHVIFGDGIEITGQVVATEPIRDVALVQIGMRGKPPLSLDLGKPKIGATVYSYGAPLDEEYQGTLRKGIISAYRNFKDGQEYLQSDVAVNPGNSGGPLLDEKGNVVGVSVSGRFDSGAPQGINFFIPIQKALEKLHVFSPAAPRSKTDRESRTASLCQPGKMIYSGCGSRNIPRESTAKSSQPDRTTDRKDRTADRTGARLTARQLKVLLVGNTETGTYLSKGKWLEYREYFRADGTIVGKENREPFSGKWSIEGDTICAEYGDDGEDDDCFYYVTKASGQYEAYGMDGTLKARISKVQKGKPL